MLDSETKARIDSARDILVGKVPDPKSQVEQITIALIYKFMDDMDRQSEELGGKATFFSGEFKKYAWNHLLDKRLSGHERLLLYAEGIEKMNVNKNIPQLFRDIFKGVFLPYRDPETLNLFLKEINCFSYDHSEQLGNAFEYLLSVMDSQGDAGQFLTPRHIIDFMVAVVNPKKDETVLDPACGTAGFLISSFKHILKHNQNLTPDERAQLMTNFCGYDISPDMVRLSRVNLYLHGFANPVIHEYDTLTSEERWDERFDVIMANPPFMSPKGGIRPHKRLAIPAKRSEVLFVDYMAEHLSSGGRAGIIVPEGIIFQSQNSYKALRKMLVEDYLWAVVSLPSGVFNPYSGVKTSILFLDPGRAKLTDEILFVKVESDGFNLGAQRRPNGRNDLTEALQILLGRHSGRDPESRGMVDSPVKPGNDRHVFALSVSRKRLLESPDINLSGERYRVAAVRPNGKWPMVKLGEVCEVMNGFAFKSANYCSGGIRVIRITNVQRGYIKDNDPKFYPFESNEPIADFILQEGDLLVSLTGNVGRVGLLTKDLLPAVLNQRVACLRSKDHRIISNSFLFHVLNNEKWERDCIDNSNGMAQKNLSTVWLSQYEIPLPPLDEQERIVAELEGYRKVTEGARQVIANYKPTIRIDLGWPMVELGKVCEIKSGGTPSRSEKSFWEGDIPWVTTTLIDYRVIQEANEFITPAGLSNSSCWLVPTGTILMAMYGQGVTRGRVAILGIDAAINQACAAFLVKNESILRDYLFEVLRFRYDDLRRISDARGGNQSNLSAQLLKQYSIPIPPLTTQQAIVAEIEGERKLVEANRELIARMEVKIKAKLAEVWGEEGIATEGAKDI